jgi:1-acyl-sn-glycerol-3-phosphate acyltransferase
MANGAVLALERRAVDRLRRFPREPDLIVYGFRSVFALIIRGLLRFYVRLEIRGAENLPNDESFVLVANHSSHLDTLCLLAALPLRRLHRAFPVAAEDYFFRSLPRTWFAAVVMNALPFARQVRMREGLFICAQLLAQPGNVLIIFPEGTRSQTGEMRPFKSGIGALLAGRDVSVLPCHLQGAFRAWPKGRRLPRPRKVRLIIGAPRNFAERGGERNDLCAIAEELRDAVRELETTDGSR